MSLPAHFALPPDSTYLVTGSTSGIGLEIARSLLASSPSSRLLICSRTAEDVAMTVAMLSQEFPSTAIERVFGCVCDVATGEGREALVGCVEEAFPGGLTGLVNNVGLNVRKPMEEQTEFEYSQMISSNVSSAYFLSQSLSSSLFLASSSSAHSSVVVNIASMAGLRSSGTG